jgi:hypothetical protein
VPAATAWFSLIVSLPLVQARLGKRLVPFRGTLGGQIPASPGAATGQVRLAATPSGCPPTADTAVGRTLR